MVFNPAEFLFGIAIYLLLLLALLVGAVRAKSRLLAVFLMLLFLTGLVWPLSDMYSRLDAPDKGQREVAMQHTQLRLKREAAQERNAKVIATYCKRQPVRVHARQESGENLILSVRFADQFDGTRTGLDAKHIAGYLGGYSQSRCASSRLGFVEGKLKAEPGESPRFPACQLPVAEPVKGARATHEIVFGETVSRLPLPDASLGQKYISMNSVRIIEIATAKVMADDMLTSWDEEVIPGDCMHYGTHVAVLVFSVFGRP